MKYTTVFDASVPTAIEWSFPAVGLVFSAFGALLVFMPSVASYVIHAPLRGRSGRIFAWVFFIFSLCWTVLASAATIAGYLTATSDLRSSRYDIVEGVVTDFVPQPCNGKGMERFAVQGRIFEYSDYRVTPGFRTSVCNGGPIREGLRIRVSHSGNLILRLEVASP